MVLLLFCSSLQNNEAEQCWLCYDPVKNAEHVTSPAEHKLHNHCGLSIPTPLGLFRPILKASSRGSCICTFSFIKQHHEDPKIIQQEWSRIDCSILRNTSTRKVSVTFTLQSRFANIINLVVQHFVFVEARLLYKFITYIFVDALVFLKCRVPNKNKLLQRCWSLAL